MLQKWAQQYCKLAGVRRLPVTMGEHWCWPRMLSWLSVGVRVGPQHGLKTIKEGIAAAKGKQDATEADGGDVAEGSVVVLLEPGVYEEMIVVRDAGQRVSIWRCDRESESNKEEMQKVEWRSRDHDVLYVDSTACVSVNSVHMSAAKNEGYDGRVFRCVCVLGGATLSLERCDLTCESDAVVQIADAGTTAVVAGCSIHDGNSDGVLICGKAKATLENNTIHSNTRSGVTVRGEGSEAVLKTNTIRDGKFVGVGICEKAKATLENNDIHSNTEAGVTVQDEGSEAVLKTNTIRDGKGDGVSIVKKAKATLEDNTIIGNDLAGVQLQDHATATLTGNTTKGNGACLAERIEEELAVWTEARVALYRSSGGFPGLRVLDHSTVSMSFGSNTIEGNGKVGGTVEQVLVDGTSAG